MKIKPITEDGLKIRISKDGKDSGVSSGAKVRHSSLGSVKQLNMSATEITMKSPQLHASSNLSLSSLMAVGGNESGLKASGSSHRTPSPSQSMLSSFSLCSASQLATPSPGACNDETGSSGVGQQLSSSSASSMTSAALKYEPKSGSKDSSYNNSKNNKRHSDQMSKQPASTPLMSSSAAAAAAKAQTPPLSSLSKIMGNSSSLSNFKIPLKPKTVVVASSVEKEETEGSEGASSKTQPQPLSASSPITASTISNNKQSPSKHRESLLGGPSGLNKAQRPPPPPPNSAFQSHQPRKINPPPHPPSSSVSPKWQQGKLNLFEKLSTIYVTI
jgi:hypothetical protein